MGDVAARREARRRKILENSGSRLKRITGVEEKTPEFIDLPASALHNHAGTEFTDFNHAETEFFPSNSTQESNEAIIKNEVQSPRKKIKQTQPQQYKKIVISALAVFIYLLQVFADLFKIDSSSVHLNNIFLPLMVYEVIDLFSLERKPESKSFLFLLLAANAKHKHVHTVMKYFELFGYFFQDLLVYFFVFVCCDFVKHLVLVVS